jgi:hypothetical protein
MISPTLFPCLTYGGILRTQFCNSNTIPNWLAFSKLPESPVVTPTNSVQVITPSAENRYLSSVTVEAIPTTPTP